MTEGNPPPTTTTRTKRLGARFFKNPPQPHMCIQDFLQGSVQPCYVNVLSWDKIATANCPFDRLRLYGGMKITPPRTEKPMTTVFFVIANPEILRANGKTASDPKEQAMLIELLLDFIEAMNKGIIFKRQYKILADIFIIGELKLIWELVQNDRAKVQNELQQSQIAEENRKSLPQYPHYQNYQQQQHQQHGQNDNEILVKPPQYQANNNHWPPPPPPPPLPSTNSGLAGLATIEKNQLLLTEENRHCMYQQYHQQQLSSSSSASASGQIFSYNVSKMHQKQNMPIPIVNNCGQLQYMSYNNYHHPENNVYVKVHRMQQPQQPQIQLALPSSSSSSSSPHGPQLAMSIEDFYKEQGPQHMAPNYHPHSHHHQNQTNLQQQSLPGQSNSPIRLLQRSISADNPSITVAAAAAAAAAAKKVQVTDLDDDEPTTKVHSNHKDSPEIIQLPRTLQEKPSSSNNNDTQVEQQQQAEKMKILKRSKSLNERKKKKWNRDPVRIMQVLKDNKRFDDERAAATAASGDVETAPPERVNHTQSAQERLVNAIAQMSIKDCTDSGEFRSLLS